MVEIFPSLSIAETWNQYTPDVPITFVTVVDVEVKSEAPVELDICVPLLESVKIKYPCSPDPVSVESVHEMFAEVIIVPVALAFVIAGIVGAVVSRTTTGVTVTVVDVENIPAEAVTDVVPTERAEKIPVAASIVPTERSELVQEVVVAKSAPY